MSPAWPGSPPASSSSVIYTDCAANSAFQSRRCSASNKIRSDRSGGNAGPVPAADAIAVNFKAGGRHDHRIFELDEAATRMLQRGLDRNDHAGLERPIGIVGIVRNRTGAGEPRCFVADKPHAMRQKLDMVVQLGFMEHRVRRRID